MVIGWMIKLTVTVFSKELMGQPTKANGSTMTSMGSVLNHGPTGASTRAHTNAAKNMVKALSLGQTALRMQVSFKRMTFAGMGSTRGPTETPSRATGRITRWRVEVSINGKMAASMWVSSETILRRAKERSTGPMAESISESGS